MIPQRNISLLANRLAKEGGRRFQESVLERDYCLAWFLAALAESDLKPVLAFKGGTALKRCYFEDYRFSEDLDFTLTEPVTFEEFVKRQVMLYQLFTLSAERFLGEFRMFAPDGEIQWGYVAFDSAGRCLAATLPGSSQILRVVGDSVYAVRPDLAGDLVMETRALSALVRR